MWRDKESADLSVKSSGGRVFKVHQSVMESIQSFDGALLKKDVDGIVSLEEPDLVVEELLRHFYGYGIDAEEHFDEDAFDMSAYYQHLVDLSNAAHKVRK